jgi:hypothetical protein
LVSANQLQVGRAILVHETSPSLFGMWDTDAFELDFCS